MRQGPIVAESRQDINRAESSNFEDGPKVESTLLCCYKIDKGDVSVSGMQLSKIHRAKVRFAE
jgi:hypothetical protein